MDIAVQRIGGPVVVVRPRGRLTAADAPELKSVLADLVAAGRTKVVVDLEETTFLDSSGLGALVTIAKRVREAGGQIRLAGLNDDLRSLFELTKLDTLFAIYPGVEEALQGY